MSKLKKSYHTVHNIHYAPCGFSLKLYAEDDTLETLSRIILRSNSSSFLTLIVTWWPDKKFSATILYITNHQQPSPNLTDITKMHGTSPLPGPRSRLSLKWAI